MQSGGGGKRSHSVSAELQRWAFRTRISKAKAEAGSPEWPVKAAARGSRSTGGEARGSWGLGRTPRCGQLPDAVVSERVPASREEELGAWPDSPRLCRPRALLLLPGGQVGSEHGVPARPRPAASIRQRVSHSGLEKATQQALLSTHQVRSQRWRKAPFSSGRTQAGGLYPNRQYHESGPTWRSRLSPSLSTCVSAQLSPRQPSPQVWG